MANERNFGDHLGPGIQLYIFKKKMNQRKTTPIQFGFIWINWVEDIYAI